MGNLAYMGFWRVALDRVEDFVKAQTTCAVREPRGQRHRHRNRKGSDWRAVGALLQESRRDI
jgi:hypothetical protein